MSHISSPPDVPVSPEEIQRRIDAYRAEGFKHQAMPHAVYQDPFIICPWSGCGYRIVALDFQIEKSNDPAFYQQVMAAWWQGAGVAARCPSCGKLVLFSMTTKQCVNDADLNGYLVLPDDWDRQAYIVN